MIQLAGALPAKPDLSSVLRIHVVNKERTDISELSFLIVNKYMKQ